MIDIATLKEYIKVLEESSLQVLELSDGTDSLYLEKPSASAPAVSAPVTVQAAPVPAAAADPFLVLLGPAGDLEELRELAHGAHLGAAVVVADADLAEGAYDDKFWEHLVKDHLGLLPPLYFKEYAERTIFEFDYFIVIF